MLEQFVIVVILLIIVGKLSWNHGRKKGRGEANEISRIEGYHQGKKKVEDEIRELCELPNKDIVKRVKSFCKNNPK